MSDESTHPELTCWFCQKGRHDECMKQIPMNSYEADCSFSVINKECECCGKRTN